MATKRSTKSSKGRAKATKSTAAAENGGGIDRDRARILAGRVKDDNARAVFAFLLGEDGGDAS